MPSNSTTTQYWNYYKDSASFGLFGRDILGAMLELQRSMSTEEIIAVIAYKRNVDIEEIQNGVKTALEAGTMLGFLVSTNGIYTANKSQLPRFYRSELDELSDL